MKSAIVITDQCKQVVLTPENETDKAVLSAFKVKDKDKIQIYVGSFYDTDTSPYYATYKSSHLQRCEGGWVREYRDSDSVIIVVDNIEIEQEEP